MNDTTMNERAKVKINPSGFLDSIEQVEIKIIDVNKMVPTPIVQNPPSVQSNTALSL